MFADVMMASPHYGKISVAQESRYIGNFEGGTPTHAAHGMADVRSAPTDCSSADFGQYVNKIAGSKTHMARSFFHGSSSPLNGVPYGSQPPMPSRIIQRLGRRM
jgi:hypothetical protein